MISDFLYRFQLLFVTNPEIEQQPFLRRPRTMAAVWGGLVMCKLAAMVLISFSAALPLAVIIAAGGAIAVQVRFRREHRPVQSWQASGEASLARQAA